MGFGTNQLAEAKAVVEFAKATAKSDPYLVVGDFNTAPATPVYEFLTRAAGLGGAQELLKQIDLSRPEAFSTAGFLQLRMHLDHLFSGNELQFVDLEGTRSFGDSSSPFSGLSDHVPLIANFELG
jgi:endonuclease/exonuclease/phosphatase family metal-dependent hydrolase